VSVVAGVAGGVGLLMGGLPLLWHGSLGDPSGYADEARAYLIALERCGYAAAARELRWSSLDAGLSKDHAAILLRATKRRAVPGAVCVFHLVPGPQLPLSLTEPIVIRTMFETDRVPASWLQKLAEVDEVWVPCTFNLETFERSGVGRDRLRVLPETIDFDLFAPNGGERAPGAF